MKFRILKNDDVIELACADGTYKNDLSAIDVADFLANHDFSFPDANPKDELEMLNYSGKTLLQLRDDGTIEINDVEFFREIITPKEFPYYSIKEFCADKEKSKGRGRGIVQRMCKSGRIPGAVQSGDVWYIPKTYEYPEKKSAKKKKSDS